MDIAVTLIQRTKADARMTTCPFCSASEPRCVINVCCPLDAAASRLPCERMRVCLYESEVLFSSLSGIHRLEFNLYFFFIFLVYFFR